MSVSYGNGVSGTFTYNNNLQLASLRYQKPDLTDLLNLAYEYVAPNGGNNGQISKVRFFSSPGNEVLTKTEAFQYDAWSRLANAQTQDTNPAQPNTWALTWGYDRYGNRLNQTLTAGSQPVTQPQLQISTATNRITTSGFAYDNAGNLTNDAIHTYAYDAEKRIKSMDSTAATYNYDNGGLRLKKTTGGNTTTYIYSGSKVIAEYVGGSLSKEYIYAGSQLLATIAGSNTTYSYSNHLSVRARADASGNPVATSGHLPFGEVWYETGTPDKWKFTSYERDSESNLDYAIFRYDSSRLGRFMSPDPLAGSVADPQSLNRYSYVRNDPANLVDPLGLWFAWFCDLGPPMWQRVETAGDPIWVGRDTIRCMPFFVGPFEGPRDEEETFIQKRLRQLKGLLDPNCIKFLSSKGIDVNQLLDDMIKFDTVGTAYIPAGLNSEGKITRITNAVTPGVYVGHSTTLNLGGAFFNSSFAGMRLSTDRGKLTGGTQPAQLFILLHEVAHSTEVLQHDFHDQKKIDENDKTLEKECKDTIKSFSK